MPPLTDADPEKDRVVDVVGTSHARPRTVNLIAPCAPLRTALPLNATHVLLVKTPCPEPRRVLAPISLPRPLAVALPDALVPFTWPVAVPVYVALKA